MRAEGEETSLCSGFVLCCLAGLDFSVWRHGMNYVWRNNERELSIHAYISITYVPPRSRAILTSSSSPFSNITLI